jgi:hypothetical protein
VLKDAASFACFSLEGFHGTCYLAILLSAVFMKLVVLPFRIKGPARQQIPQKPQITEFPLRKKVKKSECRPAYKGQNHMKQRKPQELEE